MPLNSRDIDPGWNNAEQDRAESGDEMLKPMVEESDDSDEEYSEESDGKDSDDRKEIKQFQD